MPITLHILRVAKLVLGTVWGLSVLTLGVHLGLNVSPMLGLGVAAMGEFVLMYLVLDDLVRPVHVETTAFLKLTAALTAILAGSFAILDWQAILSALTRA